MEQHNVCHARVRRRSIVFKFHEDAVLQILSLQECLSINGTVEKAGEAQVPHEVATVFTSKEILVKILREIDQN